MSKNIHFCQNCADSYRSMIFVTQEKTNYYRGYTCCMKQEKLGDTCPMCGKAGLVETNITEEELKTIGTASNFNSQLLAAMRELKDRDIIEYELKMSQFRSNVSKMGQTTQEQPRVDDRIKCPKCGSTSITTGARGTNGFWGFIGASKTVNRCGKCGYTWKP